MIVLSYPPFSSHPDPTISYIFYDDDGDSVDPFVVIFSCILASLLLLSLPLPVALGAAVVHSAILVFDLVVLPLHGLLVYARFSDAFKTHLGRYRYVLIDWLID